MDPRDFLDQFSSIDPRFSPAPIWWWSGEKLEIGRMRWQMDQLSGMGIHNVVILNLAPSGPLFGSDADDPPFLSEQWWTIFGQVCDHARDIGMFIWFYDQIGFSGANYQAELVASHPEFAAEKLHRASIEGRGRLEVTCPAAGTPLATYIVDSGGSRSVAIDNRSARVELNSPAKLHLVYTIRQGYDYFNRAACEKLLDTVHRQFEKRLPQHLGSTIIGSFQDELPDLPTWSRDFAQAFYDSFGYRLEDVIYRLFEEGDADSRRTRLHYHQHRANLAEESLFKPFYRWHEEHGLQCGFDQQSPAREARALGCVQKYADYIQTHRWYAAPGCDLHGNAKLHSSIAFMYDRPRVWIEGFHSTGWGGTIADTFDWLLPFLRSGSNLYNPHAVYYSTRMGWWEWAPPSTCWRQPYARHYKPFADMIARLTKLLSQGVHQASVGVIFPTATVQSAVGPLGHFPDAQAADHTLHRLIGSMRWYQNEKGLLDAAGLDFHLLDEATVQASTPSPCTQGEARGEGAFSFHGVTLPTLILPHTTTLEDATIALLRAFARAGGRVIAIGTTRIETPDGEVLDIATLPNATFIATVEDSVDVLATIPRTIGSPVPFMHRQIDDLHLLFVPAVAEMATKVVWKDWFANLESATADPERYLKSVELTLPSTINNVCRFDPIDAEMSVIPANQGKLHLDFGGAPFALLAWSENGSASATVERRGSESTIELSDSWSCEYLPTMANQFPDTYDPRQPELTLPHTSEFTWQGRETVRATFGVYGTCGDKPLVYSPQFGIAQDSMHWYTLGPKGHVPEEFIDLGKLESGQSRTITTAVHCDRATSATFALGANAHKSIRIGQQRLESRDGAHQSMWPLELTAGSNPIEISLTAERDGRVRAFWCLLKPGTETQFRRPERMIPSGDSVAGTRLTFQKRFDLTHGLDGGRMLVTTAAVASVFLDGTLLGRQGGFDPYRLQPRAQPYDLPPLESGEHELRIEVLDPGAPAPLLVDLLAGDFKLMSDSTWTLRRDDGPAKPVKLHSKQDNDGAAWHLYRRPHPLPRAGWLEGPQPDVVLDLPVSPPNVHSIEQTFEWTIPPGATAIRLPLTRDAQATLYVDGKPVDIQADGIVGRNALLKVKSRHLGGGVFTAPVSYEFGEGVLHTGSWLTQGLRSYSGAIRMRQKLRLDTAPANARLDLGRVRGTVEAHLNGQPLGVRFMPPYRFELGNAVRVGENQLELIVTNTLANFLSTWSPTRGWSPDQFDCGVFGPVRIVAS